MEQIQEKMTTKFSNTFKNPTFGPFSTFSRQKVSLNSGSVMHNTTWASNTMLRIKNKQKKRKKRANPKKTSGQKGGF